MFDKKVLITPLLEVVVIGGTVSVTDSLEETMKVLGILLVEKGGG